MLLKTSSSPGADWPGRDKNRDHLNKSLTLLTHDATMVRHTRFRAFLIPLLLYSLSGLVAGYFIWHAVNGGRGLKVKAEYKKQIAELNSQREALKAERATWEQRISLIRGETIDRDLLEEEARSLIGRVHKNDVIVFLGPKASQ